MTPKMRTDLSRVRGLGSAREGTGHFWQQRLTAIANVVLTLAFVILLAALHDKPFPDVRAAFAHPLVGLVTGLMMVAAAIHMRLGMQVIVEDYVHGPAKVPLLVLSTFFSIAIAAAALLAIVKMSLGG